VRVARPLVGYIVKLLGVSQPTYSKYEGQTERTANAHAASSAWDIWQPYPKEHFG